MILHKCPQCGEVLQTSDELAGQARDCVRCRAKVAVPKDPKSGVQIPGSRITEDATNLDISAARTTPLAWLFLAGAMLASLLVGIILGVVAHWFYLIVLFPIGLAVGVVVSISVAVDAGKIQNRAVIIAAVILATLIAYCGMHFAQYEMYLYTFDVDQFAPRAQHPDDVRLVAQLRANQFGFVDYIERQMLEGMEIARLGGSRPMKIPGGWMPLYWLAEVAIAVYLGLKGMVGKD